jgi:hypothetical protein
MTISKARLSLLFAVLALALASTCEARTKLVDSWKNKEAGKTRPEKIAVIAVLPEALARQAFEIDVVKKVEKKGRTVVAGSSLPGLGGGIRGKIDTEAATRALENAGVDGVIVMFYTGGGISGSYARSDYWARYEGTGVGYAGYNWGQPYFVDVYSIQKGPGYSDTQTSALVETSYYDLRTRQPLWRIVTETKDMEHSDAAVEIGKKIASQMRSAGL